jgi:nicotinate dehydrogenase subunit B
MTTKATIMPFSRRDILKGGALIVGFNLAAPLVPRLSGMTATPSAAATPDPAMIDSWIALHADNTATVFLGKCELGQGATTGLLQIAGEELDLDMSQLKFVRLDTNLSPNQGATTSSSSIHRGGPQVRAAAAEARQTLLLLAAARLGVQTGSLTVSKGVVSIDGEPSRSVTYGELIGDKPFNITFTGTAPQKPVSRYLPHKRVGRAGARRGRAACQRRARAACAHICRRPCREHRCAAPACRPAVRTSAIGRTARGEALEQESR